MCCVEAFLTAARDLFWQSWQLQAAFFATLSCYFLTNSVLGNQAAWANGPYIDVSPGRRAWAQGHAVSQSHCTSRFIQKADDLAASSGLPCAVYARHHAVCTWRTSRQGGGYHLCRWLSQCLSECAACSS